MYLPDIFKQFMEDYPEIADAHRKVGDLCSGAGPLDEKTRHLVQLAVSVGVESKGGVKSHVRRALDAGATKTEIMQTVLLSTPTIGFPSMIAAYGWASEVLSERLEEA